jgi:hypothetical protein
MGIDVTMNLTDGKSSYQSHSRLSLSESHDDYSPNYETIVLMFRHIYGSCRWESEWSESIHDWSFESQGERYVSCKLSRLWLMGIS